MSLYSGPSSEELNLSLSKTFEVDTLFYFNTYAAF